MDLVEGMTCIDQAIFGVDQWQEYRRGGGLARSVGGKKGWIESYLKAVLGRWRGGLVEEWESMWIGGRRVFFCVFYVQ